MIQMTMEARAVEWLQREISGMPIMHDYDIRGFNGIKYIFSNEHMMLTSWDPQHADGNISASNSLFRSAAIPHITIVAQLEAGVSAETFLAKSDGAPLLVWKEIPLDEDHEGYAQTEVSMYDGPLSSLQGSVVSTLYGVFHDQEYNCVVLLMEYVGNVPLVLNMETGSQEIYVCSTGGCVLLTSPMHRVSLRKRKLKQSGRSKLK